MEQRNAISKTGLLVTLIVLIFFVALMFPALSRLKKLAQKDLCVSNMKGLGTATIVYSNDYNDKFPQLPGKGPWSKNLGFSYDLQKPDFTPGGPQELTERTITASLYLLIREADVSPKTFICPHSEQTEFYVSTSNNEDLIQLWDFGHDPYKHVSYSFHNPYGRYPANGTCSAYFAVASDMNPWFKDGNILRPGKEKKPPQIISLNDESTWSLGNSLNHKNRDWPYDKGQNVLYADGHTSYKKEPNVGLSHDNIYTFWSTTENPTKQDIQGGTNPTSRSKENDAKSKDDSFLAI